MEVLLILFLYGIPSKTLHPTLYPYPSELYSYELGLNG